MSAKLVAAVIVVLSASLALPASAQTNITSCETISTAGSYAIPPHATLTSSGGDCLVITAANVDIQTQIATIQGTGASGAGIHVMSSARNFTFEPFSTNILNYSSGIELDSTGARIYSDYGDPLWIEKVSTGILVKSGAGNIIDGIGTHATYNGVWISGGSNNIVTGYETSIEVGQNATECCWEVVASDADAIRIENSTGNLIYQVDVTQGTSVGVHIVGTSKYNSVLNNLIQMSGVGIGIKSGAGYNFINNNTLKNNQLDVQDGNTNCDHDLWAGDTFSTNSPSCAQ